ncbi:MAG: small ribosomal subunit biogenesis GTPase RsgA [Oleiphilaceae bacterium]|nr:small ribosomal subunit biogenesis GTPase RsgA [Oleiphilaceae bacterium]
MAKRKLNRRQQWRIKKIQEEKTERAKRRESRISDDLENDRLGGEQTGMIIAHYGQQIDVQATDADFRPLLDQPVHRCHVRANLDALVTGDRVVWRAAEDGSGIIEARLDRDTLLQRPDNFGQLKPVAANIDRIIIVVAVEPEPHANLIDRYLVAAETLEIQPTLLLNKADLITETNRNQIDALIRPYSDMGYEVLYTTAQHASDDNSELMQFLTRHTSVFVGQSGVGKSSIIRSILGDDSIKVGELSETTRKGTHTTTTARLFHLPCGGQLVDSPGIREFGLWHINEQDLLHGFIEFRPHLGLCKFRDCRHEEEPGCAIRQAYDDGQISEARMSSFRRIRATLDDKETY